MSILTTTVESGNGLSISLNDLCSNYYQAIKRHVSMHIDYEAVEDITQEVFFRAVRAYPGLSHDTYLYAYLVRIANNVMMDYRRRPRQKYDHCEISTLGELLAKDGDPYEFCDTSELSPAMRSAWLTLPPRHKRVIAMLMAGYKAREIAARMGWLDYETYQAIKEARAAFKRRYRVYRQEVA
jgi:RNA polymerase sigma factor (sigma-70 family)